MITYTITGDNVIVDDSVRMYVEDHFKKFERFLDQEQDHELAVICTKTTAHEREDTFRAEVRLTAGGEHYHVHSDNGDIFSAIDGTKDILLREITKKHGKDRALFARGARRIKTLAKGLVRLRKKKR